MNNEIEDLEESPGDDTSGRSGPAYPEVPASAVEPKRPISESDPAPAQAKRKTKAGASTRKRRKRFVL
jgi:hypothetical protein